MSGIDWQLIDLRCRLEDIEAYLHELDEAYEGRPLPDDIRAMWHALMDEHRVTRRYVREMELYKAEMATIERVTA